MRPPKPATADYLERVALHYMERFPATVERVRRVLRRRVARAVEAEKTAPEAGAAALEQVIEKLSRLGYLDDARVAASRARSLRRRGKSSLAIRQDLRRLGVDGEHIDQVVASGPDVEREAADVLVRRRRLGRDPVHRERDLARLARAGFSFEVARAALAAVETEWDDDVGDQRA